jgi:hypothetical protein
MKQAWWRDFMNTVLNNHVLTDKENFAFLQWTVMYSSLNINEQVHAANIRSFTVRQTTVHCFSSEECAGAGAV